MEIIKKFDKKIIDSILKDFTFNGFMKEEQKFFVGFKERIGGYFSFFISLYKNQILLFTFRENVEDKDVKRIYVSYETVNVIRQLINLIIQKKNICKDIYEKYLYREENEVVANDNVQKCNLIIDQIMSDQPDINDEFDDYGISYRLKKILYDNGIYTIKKFLNTSNDELYRFKFVGQRTYAELLKFKQVLNGDSEDSINFNEEDNWSKNNAGSKWERFEEKRLIEEFYLGKSIEEMAKSHGRTKGAIRRRLFRLGLIK